MDLFPDEVLLENFNSYVNTEYADAAYADPRVPKMANDRVVITASPEPPNFMKKCETSEEDAGYLASLLYCPMVR